MGRESYAKDVETMMGRFSKLIVRIAVVGWSLHTEAP
jgi:hypothetical protein